MDITGLTIPASVKSIDSYVFNDYSYDYSTGLEQTTSLTSVYYTGTIEDWCEINFSGAESNPMFCANDLYFLDDLVSELDIPIGITSIGNYTFFGCTGLTSVSIPNGVTSIGYCAFSGCKGLSHVTIPAGVMSIGDSAFSNCTGLTNVSIPDSVTSIGSGAFYGCTSLADITLPFVGLSSNATGADAVLGAIFWVTTSSSAS